MVFSGWMSIGFAPWTERPGGISVGEPVEGSTRYESLALEDAQNTILTAVAQRTPKDKQQARIQRLLGFSIGLVSISAEPVLSHPFIVCRLQRQMHTVAPLGSARKDPLRMLRHMDGVLDKYGLWALYQGFGTFITMNTLSTVAYLTVRGTLQGIFGDPLGTEDENDLERSYTNEGVPYAAVLSTLLQRSLSAMATLPFYAATIVCLVRDCTHSLPAPQHMSMWCTLFRQVPSAVVGNCRGVATVAVAVAGTGVGGRVGMIPLYRLALPFALTVLVNDTFEEFFTFASFTHLMGMVLGDSAETDKPSTGGSLNSTDGTGMRVGRTHNVTDPPITHLDNESWDDFSVTQAHSTLGERPHTPVNGFFNGGAHGIATGDEPRGGGGAYQDDLPSHTSADVEKDTQGDKPVGTEALLAFVPDLLSTFVGSLTSEFLTYPLWVVLNRLIVQGNGCLIVDTISGRGLVPVDFNYTGYWNCVSTIWSEEGIFGFYRGFSAFTYQYGAHLILLKITISAYKYFSDVFVPPPPPQQPENRGPQRSANPAPWRDSV